MPTKLFEGYSKTGNRVRFVLEDNGFIYVIYIDTGLKRRINNEHYDSDFDFNAVKLALLNEGYRI